MTAPIMTPFTDPFGHTMTHQNNGFCQDFELNFFECMERVGLPRGTRECKDFYDDFVECIDKATQRKRMEAMHKERDRQVKAGERKKEDAYPPSPNIDIWQLDGMK